MIAAAWLQLYAHVAALLLPVAACASVGAFWALRRRSYPADFVAGLATAVATPALVFHTLLTTRLDDAVLLQLALAVLMGLAAAALVAAAGLRLARLPVRALLPSATFPNSGNLGLPVAQLAFGDTGLAVAVAFFAICSLVQHTAGVWVLDRAPVAAGDARRPRQAWPHGVAFACAAAVALRLGDVEPPEPVLASARLVGSLTVPLMLLSLGHALATVSRGGIGRGSLVGVIRLVAGLAAGGAVVLLLDLPPAVAGVIALQLLMPVAVVNYMYAARYTRHGELAAGAVLVSTLLFVLLAPPILWWAGASFGFLR